MNEAHDAWFFIGIFVFIFLIWIATGGPIHPIAFTGPRLAEPGALGGGTYLLLPRSPLGIGNSNVILPGSSNGRSLYPSNDSGPSVPPITGGTFGASSPYSGLVRMEHYVSGAGSSDPARESIMVSVAQDAGIPVDISEWTLESDTSGVSALIPKGTDIPISGTVNAAQDIVLNPGEQATIISGRSPIGASFRENKCIGYFSTFQSFTPSLPQNCPVPNDELVAHYAGDYIRDVSCIDYVNRLSRCQATLSPPVTLSGTCQSFLIKYLNYNGCVDAHKTDADFKSGVWRIYLGRTTAMWRAQHEIVKLVDIHGKTVDAFSY